MLAIEDANAQLPNTRGGVSKTYVCRVKHSSTQVVCSLAIATNKSVAHVVRTTCAQLVVKLAIRDKL